MNSGPHFVIDNGRHYREIQEADPRKEESLSVLAHELRTPLAAIRYAVAMLRRCSKDEEAILSAQNVIDDQLTHMVRLVDDLLTHVATKRKERFAVEARASGMPFAPPLISSNASSLDALRRQPRRISV